MVDTLGRSDQDIDANRGHLVQVRQILVVGGRRRRCAAGDLLDGRAQRRLPDIALETAATQTQLTWIVDGYTLVLACLLLPAGAMGDRYGRRGALFVGLAIFAIASLAPTIFDSPPQIIVARAVAGVGAAFIMPATLSLLTAAFPKAERNKAVGIWAGVASSGAVVGFMGTGLLLHSSRGSPSSTHSRRPALGLFVCTCTIASSRDETATPLDWIGAVLIGGAVAVFVFGVVEAPVRGWTHPIVWGCMSAGVAFAGVFAVVELRRKHPLFDVRLFGDRISHRLVGITFLFFANFGFFFVVNAVHAADPGLQPATDRVRAHAVGGTDHGPRRDDASLSSRGWACGWR